MNEITPSSQAQVGDIVAVHPLGDDALLLLAWSEEELPSEGLAAFRDRKAEKGRFRAYAWRSPASPPPSPRASWYLIAVRLDGAGAARAGDILALQAAPGRRPMLARMPEAVLDASEFTVRLAAALSTQQVAAATFLRQTFSTEQGVPESVARFLAAYFRRVAREDGAIEIVGALASGLVLLQGWSGGLP